METITNISYIDETDPSGTRTIPSNPVTVQVKRPAPPCCDCCCDCCGCCSSRDCCDCCDCCCDCYGRDCDNSDDDR